MDSPPLPASWRDRAPPRYFRWIEGGSIVAALGFCLVLAREIAIGLRRDAPGVLAMLAVSFAAYLATDFVSGVVHFVGDSFGSVDTPLLGPTFVRPFRSHHDCPEKIRTHDFIETNGNNSFASLFGIVPTWAFAPVERGGSWVLVGLFVFVFTLLVVFTNQIHKWAHVESPPGVVKRLQDAGILLSPAAHAAHHHPPYGAGYCITAGFCNRLLDRIGFFPRLERAIRWALRLETRTS